MERVFLLENDLLKITILRTLIEDKEEHTLHSLKVQTGVSYSKLQNLAADLDHDMREYFQQQILTSQGKLAARLTLAQLGEYRAHLIKRSVPYQFIYHATATENFTLEDFLEKLYISNASVSRRLQPLKKYLKEYGLKMNTTKMRITGNEFTVRMLLFNLFWQADQGQQLRTAAGAADSTKKLIVANWMRNLTWGELELWLSVFHFRQKKGFYVPRERPVDFKVPEVPEAFSQYFQKQTPSVNLRYELGFLCYMLIYFPMYFDAEDPRIPYLIETYQNSDADAFTAQLLRYCDDQFALQNLDPQDRKLLYLNLLNGFSNYQVTHSPPPMMLDFFISEMTKKEVYYRKVNDILLDYFTNVQNEPKYNWIKNCRERLAQLCTYYLLPHYNTANAAKLSIGIQQDANHFLVGEVSNLCRNLPYIEPRVIAGPADRGFDITIAIHAMNTIEVKDHKNKVSFMINDLSKENFKLMEFFKHNYYQLLRQQTLHAG